MSAGQSTSRRFHVLGGPRGYLTCVPADSPLLADRYARWQRLATVNRPLTMARADASKSWALRAFEAPQTMQGQIVLSTDEEE